MSDPHPPFDFATGNTNPDTFPTEAMLAAAERAIPIVARDLNRYPGKLGYEPLRRLMAERERAREGVTMDPERVMLTNGSMQAITLVAETLCTGEDDLVVLEEFNYAGTINSFRALGIEMVGVPVDGHGMRIDALEATLARLAEAGRAPRFIYTLATYQNPTGTVMPRERRLELIDVARRHGCIVFEDNCYGDVHFDGEKPPALYALDEGPNQIYVCSLSKILAPGVRLGYLFARPPLFERFVERRQDAGPNTLAAAIASELLDGRLWEHVEAANDALRIKRDAMLEALDEHLGNLASWSRPPGGLFIWLRLADDVDLDELEARGAERGLTFAQGNRYHVAGSAGPHIRLAFGYPTEAAIREGIAILADCVRAASAG